MDDEEGLTLERNAPSFFRGEKELFQQRVPLEDLLSLGAIGVPLTVLADDGYALEELLAIAEAVAQGGGTLTVRGRDPYTEADFARLSAQAAGRLVLA